MTREKAGYTLIELVMVIILVGIMFLVTAPLMVEISRGWQIATLRTDMSESGMVAMDRMSREIRQIRNNKSVVTATASVFRFFDLSNNDITYSISGTNLIRTINGASNQLAANVSSLGFTYYRGNYNDPLNLLAAPVVGLGTVTDIKTLVIGLTFSNSGTTLSLQDGVYPRRLQ